MFEIIENPTLVRVSDGIIEVQAYCLLISRQGFFITVETLQGITFVEKRQHATRVTFNGLLIGGYRFLAEAKDMQRITLTTPGARITRVKSNSLIVCCQRLLVAIEITEQLGFAEIDGGVISVQGN